MPQRLLGVGLLVLALLTVAVVANTRPIAGTAGLGPVPAAPVVGDCVLSQPIGVGWDISSFNGSSPSEKPWATAETGTCQGRRFGEIVAVGPAPATVDDYTVWVGCADQAWSYLDIPRRDPASIWSAGVQLQTGLLWPTEQQAAAGQSWLACALTLPADGGGPGAAEPVEVTLRGGWDLAVVRDRSSICSSICAQGPVDPSLCTQPHRMEVIGYADLTPPPVYSEAAPAPPPAWELSQPDLEQRCQQEAAAQTGMTDVTAGGTVAVNVVVMFDGPGQDGPAQVAPNLDFVKALDSPAQFSYAQCVIQPAAPDRLLVGSLRGLGDRPVPFA